MQGFQAKLAASVSATWSPLLSAADTSRGRAASPGSPLSRVPLCLPPLALGAFNLPKSRPDWPVSCLGDTEPEPGHDGGQRAWGCPLPPSSVPLSPTPPVLAPSLGLSFPISPVGDGQMQRPSTPCLGEPADCSCWVTPRAGGGRVGWEGFPGKAAPWVWSPRFSREARNPGLHRQCPDFLN